MKWLYEYPQSAYPYVDLIETKKKRNRSDMEYKLLDTGVFELVIRRVGPVSSRS